MPPTATTLEYASEAPKPLVYSRLAKHHLLDNQKPDYLRLILTAKVYEILKETPLVLATNLSAKLGNEIWLKREDLQEVFSFKIRGAYNFMASLNDEERWKGVITCSAGNHAQGVALSGSKLSIPCTIVMPRGTPSIKVRNVERLGAKVILHGIDFDEAKAECARLADVHGLVFVPPYDDPLVIAGQGTIGMEILKQLPDSDNLEGIFAAVGGGGLVAGISAYVKRIGNPRTKVFGVETVDGDAMDKSLAQGERITLPEVGPFSDGTAVRIVGSEGFRICKELLDGVVKTDNDAICAAIKDIFEETRSITEPAGALAVAGLKHYILKNNLVGAQKRFVAVISGANMNFDRLRFVAERAELGEGREALFSVDIPEKPGSFLTLHTVIHPRDVTEFIYRYNKSTAPDRAHVLVSFKVDAKKRTAEIKSLLNEFEAGGMKGYDISDNELAKSHGRYLIGGSQPVPNERIFRFEFPERPNALRNFLLGLRYDWNISLFHYRNHGADIGKVLAGIQVPPLENDEFDAFLKKLNYTYVEETENPVYKRFLHGDE
ncbi:tryptophan synthase beta subunit-like PLP-dependent enzyme [Lentinula edodes]|uniref:Threonine dehydratase n=1 Tax=Lentinula edodes TaxID=5353 RepID=A0A1Q3EDC9_LENED|nr:tryptophan synthase beta subunit-like PLP-dependent enzyme [Lentinula edodes]KAH7874773.1 tryptophan synthase beta subunit-like PLP-dependent enzyme [Lentinula edodes]KAJ3900696.1 tryptophan synthase beta subunit-like PLP-dependent enzyme [Lentinula edodes]KAJ3919428.1 tryptophan synthase beta subunit-like PLP-dependent enzyme [Lentinula edodes]GAW05206.1 threonine ammonia-lyase [Lentinula edodes]